MTMEPTTLTSLTGSLMSLFGLLVSLFSVHLGNWPARLRALHTKWQINSGSDDKEVAARRECRYVFAELYSWQPFVMTAIIAAFGVAVLYFFHDVRTASSVEFPSIFVVLFNGFFAVMLTLQLILLSSGWRIGTRMKDALAAAFPKPPRKA